MKISYLSLLMLLTGIFFISEAQAQERSLGEQVNKKVNMYVFPAKDQSAEQQVKDQDECYQWAVQQSGVDPLNPPRVEAAQVQQGPDGSGIAGAAGGAAVGAAIGAIAGDAGKGAAIGAIAGGLRGARSSQAQRSVRQQANNMAAGQKEAELMNNFKKAYSVCLEGKGYTVK